MDPRAGRHSTGWFDLSAGVAGDMLLAALVDAGGSLERMQAAVDAVIPGTVRLVAHEVVRAGMRALKVDVELLVEDQPHRRWSEIRDRVTGAELDDPVRSLVLAAFGSLAQAEARVHGVGVDDVHFHEVGAWDSIADVVGVCAGVVELDLTDISTSRISLGSGAVRAAHGTMPVPVPAVLELCRGWQVTSGGDGELATPTGLALVTALAARQEPLPALRVHTTGVGAGSKDISGRPNVVRLVVGDTEAVATETGMAAPGDGSLERRDMVVLEANVDDLDPRVWPSVVDDLLAAGAADAWLTPMVMKRGRPAQLLSVLADPQQATQLLDLVFRSTSTIGVRETSVTRWALARGWHAVLLDGHRIGVKVAHREGRIVHATPEFRDVEAAALALSRPVRDVLEAAVAAAAAAHLTPGADVPAALDDHA
ncbi:nickel pincer cofactor biosynthesis protein LarC [Terrabacter ginsenosidimutans]|uniref:Pyridinium-3,5-bisthiocarboxylic acid mononucleotide nickel insertion protein n=1 Tax=Terrabacter ginsenosidimutans TaxID=490575 RepID=A0ABP7DDF3_9MICO